MFRDLLTNLPISCNSTSCVDNGISLGGGSSRLKSFYFCGVSLAYGLGLRKWWIIIRDGNFKNTFFVLLKKIIDIKNIMYIMYTQRQKEKEKKEEKKKGESNY